MLLWPGITTELLLALLGAWALVWRGVGAVAVSWLISLLALVVGGLLIFVARRLERVRQRLEARAA